MDTTEGAAELAPALVAGGLLLLVGLGLLPLLRLALRGAPRDHARAPWGLPDAALVLAAGLAGLGAATSLVRARGVLPGLFVTAAVLGIAVAVALLVALRHGGDGKLALGVVPLPHALGGAARGVAAYFAALPLILAVGVLWPVLARLAGHELGVQPVLEGIVALGGGRLLLAATIAVLVAPLLEEILFRGFLQPLLAHRLGLGWGIVATSLVFASLHPLVALPPVFALALLLGAVRHRTGSVVAAWAVHGVHNGVTLLIGLSAPEALP